MKFNLLFACFIVFIFVNQVYSQQKALEFLYGNQMSEDCLQEYGCLLSKKTKAIFPLRNEEEIANEEENPDPEPSALHKFSYKHIFFYKGKVAIFNATQDVFPKSEFDEEGNLKPGTGSNAYKPPPQQGFLANFPLETLATPCDKAKDVCTVKEQDSQVFKKRDININWADVEGVKEELSEEEIRRKCIILSQSLLDNPIDEVPYICNKGILDFQAMKWALNQGVEDLQFDVNARLKQLSKDKSKWDDVYVHWGDGIVYASNIKDPQTDEEIIKNPEKEQKYWEIKCNEGDFEDTASRITPQMGGLPYKGDDKPEESRCFVFPQFDKATKKTIKHYLCSYTDLDDEEKYSAADASLISNQFISDFNRKWFQCKEGTARKNAKQMTELKPVNDPSIHMFKYILQTFGFKFDRDCKEQVMENPPEKTEEQCKDLCKKAVNSYAEELCDQNKFCIDSLVKLDIKCLDTEPKFQLPPDVEEGCKVDDKDPLTEAAEKLTGKYGVDIKDKCKDPEAGPGLEQFMKAINTIKTIAGHLGGVLPDLSPVELKDVPSLMCLPSTSSLGLEISMAPFCSKVDTWFELFGYIQQKYSGI